MANTQSDIPFVEKLLFGKIFQTFRLAMHLSNMLIAFLAVVVICVSGVLMDLSNPVVASADGRVSELDVYLNNSSSVEEFIKLNEDSGQRKGVFTTMWWQAARQFQSAVDYLLDGRFRTAAGSIAVYFKSAGWAFRYHFVYSLIFAGIKLVVLCIAGGAICRISALQFARGEKPGISGALRYSTSKFISFLAAPLAPIAISVCLGLCIFLIGLLGNIPYAGEIIVAILVAFALIIGAVITIVLIGTAAGFNLMFPALAYDGLDCFDAISRAFNYIYSRPWRMAFYTGLAAVYGAICYMFVRFFAFLLLLTTRFSLGLALFGGGKEKFKAIWPVPTFNNLSSTAFEATSGWTEWFAAGVIHLFVLVVLGLIVAFIFSFYFSANTIIYSLLRYKVDNTPLEEICEQPQPVETETESEDSQASDETTSDAEDENSQQ